MMHIFICPCSFPCSLLPYWVDGLVLSGDGDVVGLAWNECDGMLEYIHRNSTVLAEMQVEVGDGDRCVNG
jgi:hypothetical protein